jgi:DNA primase
MGRPGTWKGFPLVQLEQFGIKVNDQGVWVPYYRRDRTLFRAKLFAHDGRSWWLGGQGKGQIPYGLEQLEAQTRPKALVLTEGESDTLALRIAWPDSIVAIGIPGASSWKREWAELAEGFERIYLSFDADPAGEQAAAAIRKDLPQAKRLNLPKGSDTRAVLQQLGKKAYRALIEAAEAKARFDSAIRQEWRVHDLYEQRAAA